MTLILVFHITITIEKILFAETLMLTVYFMLKKHKQKPKKRTKDKTSKRGKLTKDKK